MVGTYLAVALVAPDPGGDAAVPAAVLVVFTLMIGWASRHWDMADQHPAPDPAPAEVDALLAAADQLMYAAKAAGGDRVAAPDAEGPTGLLGCRRSEGGGGHVAGAPPVLLALDLLGTFAFALNGALTAVRVAHVDVVGVVTLGAVTALGGGILRDVLLGAVPPATFLDGRYLAVAAAGGLLAFLFSGPLGRVTRAIDVLDAAGLGLFAVTGAGRALALGVGPVQAVVLGALTGVGGGTLRDVLVRRVPSVLSSGLYAVPALVGAGLAVAASTAGVDRVLGAPGALAAAAACFLLRMVGLLYGLDAPRPRGAPRGGRQA